MTEIILWLKEAGQAFMILPIEFLLELAKKQYRLLRNAW